MLILAVDTSGSNCSCALEKDKVLIAETNLNFEKQHSVLLMPMIEDMFKKVEMTPKDLSHLAINIGPGSFTGLRIGISVVKAMSKALGIPVYTYDSFQVFASSAAYFKGNILVVSDALRNTYYSKLFYSDGNNLSSVSNAEVRDMEELKDLVDSKDLSKDLLIIGDGLIKKSASFKEAFPDSILTGNHLNIAHSSVLADMAHKDVLNEVVPTEDILPLYMRKPQAVREYEAKYGELNDNI
ncbi:MAG: tRNA (adenosine(37)-N6)-threonylcarbamoyltransferase complex dimerization subunit type 1 TsaB [Clostridiaceae bacterium]